MKTVHVVTSAGSVWTKVNEDGGTGYFILGLIFAGSIVVIYGSHAYGYAKSAVGGVTRDPNMAKEGKDDKHAAVLATAGLVIGIVIISVLLGLI